MHGAGEDAPHPDPTEHRILPADPPEVFRKRLKLMQDFYQDPHRKRKDRVLSKDVYNEIKQRWEAFLPDEDPLKYQDISHIRQTNSFLSESMGKEDVQIGSRVACLDGATFQSFATRDIYLEGSTYRRSPI